MSKMKNVSIKAEASNLQKALQSKEELQRLIENLDRLRDSGQISIQRYNSLSQEYQFKMSTIVPEIARIKDVLSTYLQSAKQQLNMLKTEIEVNRANYNSGHLTQASYLRVEQKTNDRLHKCREEFERLSLLVNAKTSHEANPASLKKPGFIYSLSPRWILAVAIGLPVLLVGIWSAITLIQQQSTNNFIGAAVDKPSENLTPPVVEVKPPSVEKPAEWDMVVDEVTSSVVLIISKLSSGYSLGSGVVINPDGHIVTNSHVIDGAIWTYVFVLEGGKLTIKKGYEYKARILNQSYNSDLALLKIEPRTTALKAIKFGDSSILKLGQPVGAIGYPPAITYFNESSDTISNPVFTEGTVSGLNYKGKNGEPVIFVNIAVNKGNSGGALINKKGELIGLITLNVDNPDVKGAFGMAINSNFVKQYLERFLY